MDRRKRRNNLSISRGGIINSIVLLISLSLSVDLQAQVDSVHVFSLETFIQLVRNHHPVSAQAELQLKRGESNLRSAKGGFDPRLYTYVDQKNYDGTAYYSQLDGGVKWPSWFGVEVKAGYDQQTGDYLNPENTTPPGGLLVAGIQVPVGQGLLIDQRRAALFAARVYVRATEAERRWMLNDLLFHAAATYWEWVFAENRLTILNAGRALAANRLDFVRESFVLGSRAAIDTLEAFLQVQTLDQELQAARVANQSAKLALNTYMWSPDRKPLALNDAAVAPLLSNDLPITDLTPDSVLLWMGRLSIDHPDIQRYDLKLAGLEVDRRLKADKLKPKLNLQYNVLTEPIGSEIISQISASNYKWGLEFEFPLFLRKERGDLQMTRIKMEETTLDRDQKLLEWQNKVRAYLFEIENLKDQMVLMSETVTNYQRMLFAERIRFENGESSLFLVNSRQMKLIDSELKQVELRAKFQKMNVALRWALGKAWKIN